MLNIGSFIGSCIVLYWDKIQKLAKNVWRPKNFLKVSPVMDIEYIIKVVFSATIIPLNMKWNSLWFANHLVAPLTEQKCNNQIFENFNHKLQNENQGKVLLIMLVWRKKNFKTEMLYPFAVPYFVK